MTIHLVNSVRDVPEVPLEDAPTWPEGRNGWLYQADFEDFCEIPDAAFCLDGERARRLT
jgi:hypothetical protein